MHKVLITGATGFLGSHIAENLISNNIKVIGLKRHTSDIWRCDAVRDKIDWIDIPRDGIFTNEFSNHEFDTIIHAAWIGVESNDRNNWTEQSKNISFLIDLLEIAKKNKVKKIIFLGSQAEYGSLNNIVSEDESTNALNAYAATKLACLELLKSFSNLNNINWVWLRLFSVFGDKENDNWLIPSLVQTMLNGKEMNFTLGNQKYAYLYIKDFAEILQRIVVSDINSGVYNLSSNEPRTIRSLIEDIKAIVNPEFCLNFGALEYREGQSMHIEGNVQKLVSQIGTMPCSDYRVAIENTLKYYLDK